MRTVAETGSLVIQNDQMSLPNFEIKIACTELAHLLIDDEVS